MNKTSTSSSAVTVCGLVAAGLAAPAAAADSGSFQIVATDHGYQAPERLSAGLRHVAFENHGSQIHEAMLVKLAPGMKAADYEAAVLAGAAFPEGALDYSGPGLMAPGGKAELWLSVDPGDYVLICWFDDHLATEHVHAFTVVEDDVADAVPPTADVVVKLVDFRFEIEGSPKRGPQVIRVDNPGPSMHEVDVFRLEDGSTMADMHKWTKEDHVGKAPAVPIGGATDHHDIAKTVWLRTDFHPGRYVLWCGMPMGTAVNASSEVTHNALGMVHEFVIAD